MTTTREMVLIGAMARVLKKAGSWTGETHIQKAAYIAKVKRNIPFESEFVLYKHGPYSFEMNKSISHMISRGLLSADANPGYGPSFRLNDPLWKALNSKLGDFFSTYDEGVTFVGKLLADKNVSELERIATAVFVVDNFAKLSSSDQAKMISKLKPHIPFELASSAITEANNIH